jgi:hypothetical protein
MNLGSGFPKLSSLKNLSGIIATEIAIAITMQENATNI